MNFIAWGRTVTYGKYTIVKEEQKAIYKPFRRRRKHVNIFIIGL